MGARTIPAGWLFEFNEVTVTRRPPPPLSLSLSLSLFDDDGREKKGGECRPKRPPRGKFSRVVSRVNGLLRSTCLKVAPFRFRQPIRPRRLCHSPIQMDETGPGTRGCADARVRRREGPQRSSHPTAIRRVAVIEVIAILCPVNPTVLLPSLPNPPSLSLSLCPSLAHLIPSSLFLLVFYRRPLFGGWSVGSWWTRCIERVAFYDAEESFLLSQ